MNGADSSTRWRNLKRHLSFKGLGCCGATWTHGATVTEEEEPIAVQEEVSDRPLATIIANASEIPVENSNSVALAPSGMNLRTALAVERNLRRENVGPLKSAAGPVKTLMRLIEETEGVDLRKKKTRENELNACGEGGGNENENENGNDLVCCVCMERNKGAAFIPCGHTFCRACSREMWAKRGSCPICNRWILEILDIF